MSALEPTCSLLSVEAWRDIGGGWSWNNWHRLRAVPVSLADLKPRDLLKWLRAEGFASPESAGKLAVEDDGYNVVVMTKGTREPLWAIAYGEVQS